MNALCDVRSVVAVSRRHGLTAYDAAYLLLAEREGVGLATLDATLVEAATVAGVTLVITPP